MRSLCRDEPEQLWHPSISLRTKCKIFVVKKCVAKEIVHSRDTCSPSLFLYALYFQIDFEIGFILDKLGYQLFES